MRERNPRSLRVLLVMNFFPLPAPKADPACAVRRCVCFEHSFDALKRIAQRNGCRTVEELQQHVTFGKRCGLCLPYVQRMLDTGETAFMPLPED